MWTRKGSCVLVDQLFLEWSAYMFGSQDLTGNQILLVIRDPRNCTQLHVCPKCNPWLARGSCACFVHLTTSLSKCNCSLSLPGVHQFFCAICIWERYVQNLNVSFSRFGQELDIRGKISLLAQIQGCTQGCRTNNTQKSQILLLHTAQLNRPSVDLLRTFLFFLCH